MLIGEFYKKLESIHGKGLYRKINYFYKLNKHGEMTKYPIDDFNNWEQLKVKNNRGSWKDGKYNSFSFYIKYCKDLVCVDFDTHECKDNKLYQRLMKDDAWRTITKKGSHFYIYIDRMADYSNELKVGKDIDIDLINKKRNIWELPDREVHGIKCCYLWSQLKDDFKIDKMNFIKPPSPPVTPNISPSNSETDISENKENIAVEEEWEFPIIIDYDKDELLNILFKIKSKYEYDDWIKVGLALYNITGGHDDGLFLWDKWSQEDKTNYCKEHINLKWTNYMSTDDNDNLLGIGSLKRWAEQDNPSNPFYAIYYKDCKIKRKDEEIESVEGKVNCKGLVDLFNDNLMFVKETGEYIVTDIKSNGESCWYLKSLQKVKDHFKKYTFKEDAK